MPDDRELITDGPARAAPDRLPAPRRRFRRSLAIAACLAVLASVIGVGLYRVATTAHQTKVRRATLAEVARIGGPEAFKPLERNQREPLYEGFSETATRSYRGFLPRDSVADTVSRLLSRAGFASDTAAVESQTCGEVTEARPGNPLWTCGNFFRENDSWRVWAAETFGGQQYSPSPPLGDMDVTITVHVQPRLGLSDAFTPLRLRDGSIAERSPGLATAPLAVGVTRTVLDWSSGSLTMGDAAFGPHGELLADLYSSERVADVAGQLPALIPVERGAPVRQLIFGYGPTTPEEPSAFEGGFGGGAFVRPSSELASDGDLWIRTGDAIRRISTDGRTVNVVGGRGRHGVADGEPALGPSLPLSAGRNFAVTSDGAVWVASSQGLFRAGDGVRHVIASKAVTSVVDDGSRGVYYSTPTQVFHRVASGATLQISPYIFDGIDSIARTSDGSVFVQDSTGYLTRVRPGGSTSRVAGNGKHPVVDHATETAFCAIPPPAAAAGLPLSVATRVIASPLGGLFVEGCNRLVQIGFRAM